MSTQTPNRDLWIAEDADDSWDYVENKLGENFTELDTHTHIAADVTTGVLNPARLGTGGDGSGTHALFDDGTFQSIVTAPGSGGAAADITVTPAGNIAATDVQAALEELDTEKAPANSTFLVTTASAALSAEVAVGTTPGGELGGTWAAPTVDASHSGSTHAAVQAAAEATAATALTAHEADGTAVHGIADTSALYRAGGTDVAVADGGTGSSTAAAARTALGTDNAVNITTGTVPAARLGSGTPNGTSVLFGDNGWRQPAAADVLSGVFAPGRLGTGTANAGKYLAGDSTWQDSPTSKLYAARIYANRTFR